ncbi:MAG: hypothetical protein SPI97_07205 [Oscillospiraceae bacterium]|nr:hypothetical protein [Oscillospiraceae bacterium]
MKINKDFLKNHALTFCAAVSLLALFLPFAYMKIESSYIGDVGESISLISFIFGGGWIGAALFLFPIVLIVFNYVKPLQNLKKIVGIIAPVITIAAVLILYFIISDSYYGLSVIPSVGFYIVIVANIGAILSAVFLCEKVSKSSSEKIERIKNKSKKKIEKVKNSTADMVTDAASTVATVAKEQTELATLKSEINVIDKDLNASYSMVGRKYVEYVVETQEMPGIDVSDILKWIDPKITRKKELEAEVIEVEKRNKEQKLLREKQQAEQDYINEKEKLDKALAMEIIDEDIYNSKLSVQKKKLDNFEAIRKLELQVDMGIITEEEKNAKLYEILN